MTNEDFNHFVCIVAGESPEAVVKPYGPALTETPQVLIPITSAPEMRRRYREMYQNMLADKDFTGNDRLLVQMGLDELEGMTDIEFFRHKTKDYDHDPETGDVISNVKQGKWSSYQLGKIFSIPFQLKNGGEAYQARKKDIAWDKMHLANQEVYEAAWEMVMEKRTPENENEKTIYENMKNRTLYFLKYGTKENYVASCTAFWGFAFASEEEGWKELEPEMEQFGWVNDFYNRFIVPLPDETLLTIFECIK